MKKIVFALAASLIFFGLAGIVSAQVPQGAAAGRHKVQVSDLALGRQMAAGGARLIADYGGYQLFDTPESMTNFPAEKAELRDDYNFVLLNASRLDTSKPEVQALRKPAGSFAGKRMHLVQFAGPVQPGWRQALLDTGAQIVSYIPCNAYLLYGDAAAIARVQTLAASAPHIQWEDAYLDDYKIHPAAKAGAAKTDQFAIQLMADDAANAATLQLIDQLKLAPVRRNRHVLHYLDIVVRVAPASLAGIAAQPDVISIQPYATPRKLCERQDQIVAGNLSGNNPKGPGYLTWLENRGFTQAQFTASGFAVDVSDSGIDNGTTTPNHFGLYIDGEVASPSRVIYARLEGTPNPGSTIEGCDGHGNINAHIVGGFDNRSGTGVFEDSSGYHYGLGVCPFVLLGSSVIFDPTNFTDASYEDLMSQAYEQGARISNNSWGDGGVDGTYNLDSQEYDALVRDAQPEGSAYAAPGNQEMVIVFAAGNDGPAPDTVSPPGTGKNIISVGAAENVQIFGGKNGGADIGDTTDKQANNANAMVDFSSRGPCADGRQKPDLVAPGTHVSGGAPQAANPGPHGTALACFLENTTNTVGVDGGSDGSFFFPDKGQQFYTASSGSSHSTPCVSGGCALLRQYFINHGWTPPSPAMTKAWLMNSARYLRGSGADDTLWSPSQGMGELDLGAAFDGTPRFFRDEASGDMFIASGQTRVFTGVIANPTNSFRVTVAWTDAPGSTTGNAYNNDLDLTVTVGGQTYKGNVFSGSNSVTGGSADAVNNVESVFLPPGAAGIYTVTVTAANINSEGVPGAAGEANQDFALVVYNSAAAPSLVAAGAVLTAQGCTNGVINPGETVTVDFTIRNTGWAGTANLVATLLSSNGVFFPSAPQTYGALPPGAFDTAPFSFEADGAKGGFITAMLQLQDGAADLGTISFNFQLGILVTTTNFAEISPINLPSGWSTSDNNGGQALWTTQSVTDEAASSAFYCPDSDFIDEVKLVSPSITLPAGPWQLSFRHRFNLEDQYDGGVMYISNNSTGFQNVPSGSFVAGGYVESILTERPHSCDDPLANSEAWSGTSDGFMTTVVNLPAATNTQTIQVEWICGTDCTNIDLVGTGGWWIDSILITSTNWTSCSNLPSVSPVPAILTPSPGSKLVSTNVQIAGTATPGTSVTISNTLYNSGVTNVVLTATADAYGIFNGWTTLPYGTNILSITQTGATNAGANVTVIVLPTPPTMEVAPMSNPLVYVSGGGMPGAVINLLANDVLAANFTNNSSGVYSGSFTLAEGSHLLTATETVGPLTSGPSPAASVTVEKLFPGITVQPQSVTGFLRETVKFSTGVTGGLPMRYSWKKNGAKIAGATTNLTLAGLTANSVGSYQMIASNKYGSVISAVAVLTLAPNPFTGLTGNYYGLFPQTNVQFESSGFLTLTLGSLGSFSGKILNAGGAYHFSGAFSAEGQAQTPVSRGAKLAPLAVNMTLDLVSNTERITGYVSNTAWTAGLQADRATFSAAEPATNQGKFTMAFENTNIGGASPGGDGYGRASISAAGLVSLTGVLADNTSIAPAAAGVSKYGQWPLYIPLYGGLGSLSGWVDFPGEGTAFAGTAAWFRIGPSGKLYPAGFTNQLSVVGSSFTPGSDTVPVLNLTSLAVTLSGGGLAAPLSNAVTLYDTGKFATNGPGIPNLTLSVAPSTGVISGRFLDPVTQLPTPIKGVLLQQQTNAAGFFLGTDATGTFLLTPQ